MPAPATPSNVYVQQGNGQVLVSWDLTPTALTYSVERSTDGVTYSVVSTAAPNQFLDTTVVVGTQYYYQVAATNGSGTSPYSAPQTIVPVLGGTVTLGQLRLQAQETSDRVNSNFVTLPEWNTFINLASDELYDLLTTVYEDYYLAPPYQFTTNGNANQYALPSDFYKVSGVDLGLNVNNNAWVTLEKFDWIKRNAFLYPQLTSSFLGVFNARYRIMGNTIYFIPTPSANQVVRMWYVPRRKQLLADTDIQDWVSGWSRYIVVRAAIYALVKEESDTADLQGELMMLKQRIEETATNRDQGQPDTISDTRRLNSASWGGMGDGNFGGF